jgi:hypothetical protein
LTVFSSLFEVTRLTSRRCTNGSNAGNWLPTRPAAGDEIVPAKKSATLQRPQSGQPNHAAAKFAFSQVTRNYASVWSQTTTKPEQPGPGLDSQGLQGQRTIGSSVLNCRA